MGEDIGSMAFTRDDRMRYRRKVRRCLDVFAMMLADFKFDAEHLADLLKGGFRDRNALGAPATHVRRVTVRAIGVIPLRRPTAFWASAFGHD